MKIYLAGEYEETAKKTEFFALRFSLDTAPIAILHDEDGWYFEGNEEHRKRLGANARPVNAKKTAKEPVSLSK